MSYHRELEDYTTPELENEINRREDNNKAGMCDYCGKPLHSTPKCKMNARHDGLREA